MKGEPGRGGIGSDARQRTERRKVSWHIPTLRHTSCGLVEQRATPMQPRPRGDLQSNIGSGRNECCGSWVLATEFLKDIVGLTGACALDEHFRHEGQPWV